MTTLFTYASRYISLDGKRFGNQVITEVYCDSDGYECAELHIDSIKEKYGWETFLATLADRMYMWRDYDTVSTFDELKKLVDKAIRFYSEECYGYYGVEDWDDYIILLLEAQCLFRDNNLHNNYLRYFSL